MWESYLDTVRESQLDWLILGIGGALLIAHLVGLVLRFRGRKVLFVQNLDRYRTFCLLLTELLPVLGLLGTVLSLMETFKTFQSRAEGEALDLSQMIHAFAPAMSTTVSGLLSIAPNLMLNAIMWLACPNTDGGRSRS